MKPQICPRHFDYSETNKDSIFTGDSAIDFPRITGKNGGVGSFATKLTTQKGVLGSFVTKLTLHKLKKMYYAKTTNRKGLPQITRHRGG